LLLSVEVIGDVCMADMLLCRRKKCPQHQFQLAKMPQTQWCQILVRH